MNKQKSQQGSVLLIVTIILAIFLVGSLGYIFYQNINKNNQVIYDSYSVGDVVTFGDSDWRVIKNSDISQDYVTLVRSKELLKDASDDSSWKFEYGANVDYNSSSIKNYIETTYLPLLGADNLKEVNGYKIRLISIDDLVALGCSVYDSIEYVCTDAPSWIVQSSNTVGMGSINWTMTSYGDDSIYQVVSGGPANTFLAESGGTIVASIVNSDGALGAAAVRPVINLLKSSIEK